MKYVNHVSIFCLSSIHTYIIIHYQCLTPWSIILDWFYLKNLWRGTLYLFVGVFFLKCLVIYYTYKASFLRSSILLSAICMNILLSFNIILYDKIVGIIKNFPRLYSKETFLPLIDEWFDVSQPWEAKTPTTFLCVRINFFEIMKFKEIH